MKPATYSRTRIIFTPGETKLSEAKKVGVALGPGFPSGLVDLGLLLGLKQNNIKVSMISGTSMGAIIGAFYASGVALDEIRDFTVHFFADDEVMQWVKEDRKFSGLGPSTADKLIYELKKLTGWDPDFYQLKIPFYILAADKVSQKSVILRHGKVFDAVRASLAMPLMIEEKKLGGMRLADGAIFRPLDTEVLYAEGADFVLGIHAKIIKSSRQRKQTFRSKAEPYVLRMLGWKIEPEVYFSKPNCDILLRPRTPKELLTDGSHADELITLGIKLTYDAIHGLAKEPAQDSDIDIVNGSRIEDSTENDKHLATKMQNIEAYLHQLGERTAGMSDGELQNEFPKFTQLFQEFHDWISATYPDPQEASEILKEKMQHLVKHVDASPFMSRSLRKPRGYAGDYQMMNYLYDDKVFEAQSNMGKFLNYYVFSHPSANAVRGRAQIIQGLVQQRMSIHETLDITSIACGPAREISGTIQCLANSVVTNKINWTLLDQDEEALENAKKNCPDHPKLFPHFVNAGVRDILKRKVDLGSQDIIYSLGLFDYLIDKVAISVIARLYEFLKPGGIMLIGNFHISNPLRALMEGIMEWHLIHRTEEEQLALGLAGAPEGRHFVMAEPEGINLILVTSKPLTSKIS